MSEAFEPPPRRASPGVIGAIVVAVLVLAVIGATAGYFAAGNTRNVGQPDGSTTPSTPAVSLTTDEPSFEPPTSSPTSSQPQNGFPLPNLVDADFQEARTKVRELGLGWRLVFGSTGDDNKVDRTDPAAGTNVLRGRTITLYVRGPAPAATIPNVVGLPCSQAAGLVVQHGLYPEYPTGRSGRATQQAPDSNDLTLKWNDRVKLYCGTMPSPTAQSSP
jgi:hypothetical protein